MSTIFIVGSSSGIGKATAKLFAEKGWTVIATMRTPEKEEELIKYANVHLYPLDVTKTETINKTVEEVLEKYDVDVLFNNAGYGMKSKFEDMKEETMLKSFDTNVLGMIRVTQQFIPYFKAKKSGMILTTTSLAGEMGLALDGIYAADKWATTGLSEMLYHELYPYGIYVKTIVPGVVKTNFKMDISAMDGYEKLLKNQSAFLMPDDNLETPEEVAQDVYDAITDEDKERMCYVTGKVAKELYNKKQELGSENFRKYIRNKLMK